MTGSINYGSLMHHAMRGLIKTVLEDIAQNGLPGGHHFFITFDTTHPEVGMSDWLRERYSGEMTIVIQNWFDNLKVDDEGFSITLNFSDHLQDLKIPFSALRTFVDPSVEFGLRFEIAQEEEDVAAGYEEAESESDETVSCDAEIVSLDHFRNR